MNKELTHDELIRMLDYNPNTGVFKRAIDGYQNTYKKGDIAGTVNKSRANNYGVISLNMVAYYSHRLAWFYMTGEQPKAQIDHIDGNGLNNKFENLRDVSHRENGQNRKLDPRNTSGINALFWDKKTKSWGVRFQINKKSIWLGRHKNKKVAEYICESAKLWFGFHKNHGENRNY